ncbi:prolyl oligopeptidase family serine peptidase [Silanimonas lenta]|uniref:prolyl oligopeptidase family serine peptidase n=1 Tax=Silanimonas lenta TaxID=265429 RepID=UPI00042945ED
MRSRRLPLAITLAAALMTSALSAADPAPAPADPWLWLEEVEGQRPLDWVREQNATTTALLEAEPGFQALRTDLLAILDSNARIPFVSKQGEYFYNFWRDAKNPAGLWRRTTLEEYRKPEPAWEVLIDLDAINQAENMNWVWRGANCLRPAYARCLVSLSRGGADAIVVREWDMASRRFVEDGFVLPEAKGGVAWRDADSVYVYTDFGPGSMTRSGYPRIVKEWRRGTPLSEAKVVYEGKADDMYIAGYRDLTPGFERDFVSRTLAFYNDELYLRGADGSLTKIDAPNSASKSVYREWLVLELREDYTVGGRTYPKGALIATRFDDFMAGGRDFDLLFEPSATTALAGMSPTRNHLVLNVLEDVKNRLYVLTYANGRWSREPLAGAPAFGTVSLSPVDADEGDDYFLTVTDYLTPTTLMMGSIGRAPEPLKQLPAFFDATGLEISQHFATSKDGTRVPYFMVARKDLPKNGRNPTLLYGYGGFEISLTPSYSAAVGRAWLSEGGVYVVANIRGGGEYGPRWHQAALKENRLRAYEDFAAVAEDLIQRGITSPKHLGIQGGSNGGLLVGNMTVLYPELFGAVVCQVPLLDMRRYNQLLAGASWMAEYGNPDDPAQWEFIRRFSPYHNVKPDVKYPPVLFTTSTRDDRVHPGHARKMFALMQSMGHPVYYYENIEGGHGGAANNAQSAYMNALAYTFLKKTLFTE